MASTSYRFIVLGALVCSSCSHGPQAHAPVTGDQFHLSFVCNDAKALLPDWTRADRTVRVRVSMNDKVVIDEEKDTHPNTELEFNLALPPHIVLMNVDVPGVASCSFPVDGKKTTWAYIFFNYGRYDREGNRLPEARPSIVYQLSNVSMPTF